MLLANVGVGSSDGRQEVTFQWLVTHSKRRQNGQMDDHRDAFLVVNLPVGHGSEVKFGGKSCLPSSWWVVQLSR